MGPQPVSLLRIVALNNVTSFVWEEIPVYKLLPQYYRIVIVDSCSLWQVLSMQNYQTVLKIYYLYKEIHLFFFFCLLIVIALWTEAAPAKKRWQWITSCYIQCCDWDYCTFLKFMFVCFPVIQKKHVFLKQ